MKSVNKLTSLLSGLLLAFAIVIFMPSAIQAGDHHSDHADQHKGSKSKDALHCEPVKSSESEHKGSKSKDSEHSDHGDHNKASESKDSEHSDHGDHNKASESKDSEHNDHGDYHKGSKSKDSEHKGSKSSSNNGGCPVGTVPVATGGGTPTVTPPKAGGTPTVTPPKAGGTPIGIPAPPAPPAAPPALGLTTAGTVI